MSIPMTSQHRDETKRGIGRLRPLGAFFASVLILGLLFGSSGASAKEIDPEDASFVFYAPGLPEGEFEMVSARWGYLTTGRWLMGYPYAVVTNESLAGNWEWRPGFTDLKTGMASMTHDRASDFGAQSSYQANVGSIRYITFTENGNTCVGFFKEYGNKRIYGLYCDRTSLTEENIKAVLDGLGIRGHGVMPEKTTSRRRSTSIELIDCDIGGSVIATTAEACKSGSGTVLAK